MDFWTTLPALGGAYLAAAPLILVWLAGIALAAFAWRHQRCAAILTIAACVLALVTLLLNTAWSVLLPPLVPRRGGSASELGLLFAFSGSLQATAIAVAWGLLLAAIFAGRAARDG